MEKVKAWEKKTLITELTQGMEFVDRLKSKIDPLASPEECDLLLLKVLSSLDKSLSILNLKAVSVIRDPFCCSKNDGSDLDYYSRDQGKNIVFKKRGYYRCTHKNTQGCLATKQVQKSDKDPQIFEVTYKGKHKYKASQSVDISEETRKANYNKNQYEPQKQNVGNPEAENLNNIKEEEFPFTQLKAESEKSQFFAKSMEPFTSQITSESLYLSFFPTQEEEIETDQILHSSKLSHIEFSTTPTSVINSPFCWYSDLSVDDQVDNIDPTPMIDISEFFT